MLSESWTLLKPKTGFLGRERGRGREEGLLSAQRAKDSRHVSRGHRRPVAPAPGHSALGWRDRPPHAAGTRHKCVLGGGAGGVGGRGPGTEGEPAVGEPECSSNWVPERKFKAPERAPPPAPANRSPRAQGSAFPGPVTESRALLETSLADEAAGWGHPDLRLGWAVVLGASSGSASLGCVRCAHVGTLQFQRSGEGMAVTPSSSPEAGGGQRGASAASGAACRTPGGRGSARSGRAGGRVAQGNRSPAHREASARPSGRAGKQPSQRFAPYLPSVRPILFSALKTDMSNWQLVPNRVQRSLVEHFYSCLLQLDAYSCRLNEKQNVL